MMNTEGDRLLAAPPAPGDGRSSACIWPILVGHPVDLPTAQPPGQLRARPSQPCGYLPHRHPSMTSRSDTADTGAHGHRTPHPGQRTADTRTPHRTLDSSSRGQARADTGCSLRTPDAGRGRGHGDEGTAGIRTSWAAAPNGGAQDTQPCPSGQRPQRVATMTAQRWATCQHETAARSTRHLLGHPAGQPRLGALLSSDDFGSSVERDVHGQVLCRALAWLYERTDVKQCGTVVRDAKSRQGLVPLVWNTTG
jgi:hypothetical protein